MRHPLSRGRGTVAPSVAGDPVVAELKQGLTSLHDHCLTNLAGGLRSINGDLFNDMLGTAQQSAASTQEVSSTSDELARLAGDLNELVGSFTV